MGLFFCFFSEVFLSKIPVLPIANTFISQEWFVIIHGCQKVRKTRASCENQNDAASTDVCSRLSVVSFSTLNCKSEVGEAGVRVYVLESIQDSSFRLGVMYYGLSGFKGKNLRFKRIWLQINIPKGNYLIL